MRDVSSKFNTLRTAIAQAVIQLSSETLALIHEGKTPKGDPLPVARVAAIQASKETSRLIPYCHPVPVEYVEVDFSFRDRSIVVTVEVKAVYKTGVEMEALTGASVAALTIYDMLKIIDDSMEISSVRLLSKQGGRSDFDQLPDWGPTAAVLVVSDSVSAGGKEDTSGKLIVRKLQEENFKVEEYQVVPDEKERIKDFLLKCTGNKKVDLVFTTGGTGIGPRDLTPEATLEVIDRKCNGIIEAARIFGQQRTPFAMLTRSVAGTRNRTLIVNLPGSEKGVEESLQAIMPGLKHALLMLLGESHKDKR